MLSLEQVLAFAQQEVGNGESLNSLLDQRDYRRICAYLPAEEWPKLGFSLVEGATPPVPKEWTRENILKDLASDLEFAFTKALNRRGISSSLMFEVIQMWMWILEDDLQNDNEYRWYGLPLFKKVAVKYGLENPIGENHGDEPQYGDD